MYTKIIFIICIAIYSNNSNSNDGIKEVSNYWYRGFDFSYLNSPAPSINNEYKEAYLIVNNNLKKGSPASENECKNYKIKFKDVCMGKAFSDFVEQKKLSIDPALQSLLQIKTKNYYDNKSQEYGSKKNIKCELTNPGTNSPIYRDSFLKKEKIKILEGTLPEQFNIIKCSDYSNTLFGDLAPVEYIFINEYLSEIKIKIDYNEFNASDTQNKLRFDSADKLYGDIFSSSNLQTKENIIKWQSKYPNREKDTATSTWIDSFSDTSFSIVEEGKRKLEIIYRKYKAHLMLDEIQKLYLSQINVKKENSKVKDH